MGQLKCRHYTIPLTRYGLKADRPFRAAVLADLHNEIYHSDIDTVVSCVRANECDLVLSAGDLVVMKNGHFAVDQALALVSKLSALCPVFTANGNHETRMLRLIPDEYDSYMKQLAKAGAVNLVNETADITLFYVPLHICGLELERSYFKRPLHASLDEEVIRSSVGQRKEGAFNILLAHHPRYFETYAGWGADLTLSGHLHGGIVRLPLLGGVISPDPQLFPKYDHGRYTKDGSTMIVSAGLGTHTIPLRINNPAELVLIEFE